ncbi:hypothetical protein I79_000909 [Cricetulus griseus]|uniref:Uncharacterized protein n=1 Tax=Cricetulus griseus TaxID=10029 RepID=G3GTD1_CRIGR|nr:hypothetical protein I79_000909 [Cricetulus griseus]
MMDVINKGPVKNKPFPYHSTQGRDWQVTLMFSLKRRRAHSKPQHLPSYPLWDGFLGILIFSLISTT